MYFLSYVVKIFCLHSVCYLKADLRQDILIFLMFLYLLNVSRFVPVCAATDISEDSELFNLKK